MNITPKQFQIVRLLLRGFFGKDIDFPMAFIVLLAENLQYTEQPHPSPPKENA